MVLLKIIFISMFFFCFYNCKFFFSSSFFRLKCIFTYFSSKKELKEPFKSFIVRTIENITQKKSC